MLNSIFKYYLKERKLLTYFLVSSFFVTVLDLYGPIVVQNLIDNSIPKKNINEFFMFSAFLLTLYIIRLFLSIYSSSRGQLMGNRIKFFMREDLFKKILNQPDTYFMKNQSGDIISRVTNDLENVSALLYRGLEDFLFSILSIAGAMALMATFNLKLTLITMIPLPIAIYFTIIQNKKLKYGYIEVRERFSKLTSGIHDSLKTIFFIKDNVLEKDTLEKFSSKNKELLSVEKNNIFNTSALMSGINFYNQLTQLIVIFIGGYMHIKGEISFGIIVSFILLTNRFRVYLLRLMGLVDVFQRGATGISRFLEIMNIPNIKDGNTIIEKNIDSIKVDGLNFAFDKQEVIKNLSITIEKGEKVAFVGESGVGKTTIFSLLKRTFLPEENTIFINDLCIHEVDRESLLNRIAIVDQRDSLMNETILENIKVVKRDATKKEIEEALELAELKEFVESLEKKENTKLGQGGIELSSGQKQRLSMARLFLKDPEIIFLDEGTSALDNILEKKIMDNILQKFEDKIIISIAHRLNTLKKFNKIVVLGKDGIKEIGDFQSLIDKKGVFFNMYKAGNL
ncbi:MAG: ABC transporter ATP-binding protein [Cetobacterium somerae]|uniref:ABC transporter ATP-binding protein n=1 Tax=Cetobacterium TaxID=180162 RepID=UPI002115DAE0|nr:MULTISPECIES: ABC transporter ATP-binding protein [Cetobacterium]MCQ8211455.1 ABC transporter ATP-binding protein/permease [Cetobacterium sp. NK01]MCQ9625378.1 ABC transporter ATP-binding protein [Cetobacterium somerae]